MFCLLSVLQQCRECFTLVPFKPHLFSAPSAPEFITQLTEAEAELTAKAASIFKQSKPTNIPGSLLFLGTGSAVPSKYRNGSFWWALADFL